MQRLRWMVTAVAVVAVAAACTTAPAGGGGGGGNNNLPPSAVLVATPTSGPAPLSVAFDATFSTDADGSIIQYFWDFGDGTSGPGAMVNHVYAPGTYTAQLVVTDDDGGFDTDSVTINATNTPPVPAFTVTSTAGSAPLAVTVDASGSTDDGSIVSYSWDFDTAWAFPGDIASGVTANHTYAPGIYVIRLTVTDNNGVSASTTRTVTVSGTPAAPTGFNLTGSGCCDTYGDFAWNPVPGADAYQIELDGYFLGGCVTDHGAVLSGQRNTGRVQAVGLCLGSNYDISIRARANGTWGPWTTINRTL